MNQSAFLIKKHKMRIHFQKVEFPLLMKNCLFLLRNEGTLSSNQKTYCLKISQNYLNLLGESIYFLQRSMTCLNVLSSRAIFSFIKNLHCFVSTWLFVFFPQVEFILEALWEKEKLFCRLLCDIQEGGLNSSSEKAHTMFLLKALLVPPNKFRPPAGDGTGKVSKLLSQCAGILNF